MSKKKVLVIPGGFVPFNDTVTLLCYKHLRLVDAEMDVVALKGKVDDGIQSTIDKDDNYKKFNVEYVCEYDQAVATLEKKNVIEGIINIIKYKTACVKKSKSNDYGVVYSSSIPSFTHWAAYCVKKKNPNIKWIASFSDPLYKSPYKVDKETIKEHSLLVKIGFYVYIWIYMNSWYEKLAMKYADKIVYICEEQRDFMISHYKNKEELLKKSMVIPLNYIEDWEIYSKLIETDEHAANHPKIFSHFGRVYGLRKIDSFLLALKNLKEEDPFISAKIIFKQYGEFIPRYMKMIEKYDINDLFVFHDKINYDDVMRLMKESDGVVLFDTILPSNEVQPYLPSKSLEYLLLKKELFVLTTPTSPSNRIFGSIGYECCYDDVNQIMQQLNKILLTENRKYDYSIEQYENKQATKEFVKYIVNSLL